MPLTVNVASSTWAPCTDRPGVPCGTSGGGRHVTILYAPSAVSVPEVGFTYTGSAIVCPATERLRIQTAVFVPGEHGSDVWLAGLSTVTLPERGSVRFVSREKALAVVVPIVVPAAWVRFAV